MGIQRLDIPKTKPTTHSKTSVDSVPIWSNIDHNNYDQKQKHSLWNQFYGGTGPTIKPCWAHWRYISVSRTVTKPLMLAVESSYTSKEYISRNQFGRVQTRTGYHTEKGVMTTLADLVIHDDQQQFFRIIDEILDMDCEGFTEIDLIRCIRWALQMGAHQVARELAQQGSTCYPANVTLAALQQVTAPPRMLPDRIDADPSIRKDQTWLREASGPYQGQWVALKDGELVKAAPSAQQLKAKLGTLTGYLVTKVV
jgi:hypothetical protein